MIQRPARTGRVVDGFRWRGGDISRVEGFSDGVFAFALTLLVVSLEVPRTFADLAETMRGFVAFGACFAILLWIWVEHYRFFRRYGLEDGWTIVLNGALLFVVLFYVYPLKFMFTFLSWIFFGLGRPIEGLTAGDSRQLLLVYGGGFVAVFLVFALLHLRALRRADALEMTALERYDTRAALWRHLVSVAVGCVSLALTVLLPHRFSGLAGFTYALLGPVHWAYGVQVYRKRPPVPAPEAEPAA